MACCISHDLSADFRPSQSLDPDFAGHDGGRLADVAVVISESKCCVHHQNILIASEPSEPEALYTARLQASRIYCKVWVVRISVIYGVPRSAARANKQDTSLWHEIHKLGEFLGVWSGPWNFHTLPIHVPSARDILCKQHRNIRMGFTMCIESSRRWDLGLTRRGWSCSVSWHD